MSTEVTSSAAATDLNTDPFNPIIFHYVWDLDSAVLEAICGESWDAEETDHDAYAAPKGASVICPLCGDRAAELRR